MIECNCYTKHLIFSILGDRQNIIFSTKLPLFTGMGGLSGTVNYLLDGNPPLATDLSYYTVSFTVMGGIVGVWH